MHQQHGDPVLAAVGAIVDQFHASYWTSGEEVFPPGIESKEIALPLPECLSTIRATDHGYAL